MANILNTFFSSVFTRGDGTVPLLEKLPVEADLNDVCVSKEKIAEKIEKLKPGKSPGPDNVTVKILQTFKTSLVLPLEILFRKSLNSGNVPSEWKEANVVPIFKKGSKKEPGNYRPVSLTSIVCKIMESLLRDGIVDHLKKNSLINNSQHGFMSSKSCQTNLLEFLEIVTQIWDSSTPLDLVYLDFAKAFDKVPHSKLIAKLAAHGISGQVLNWIQDWLTGRRQRVKVNGEMSDWEWVLSGVPQGSVLGPICFIIFINDIDETAKFITLIKKFADDTKIGQKIQTLEDRDKLQECLNYLVNWGSTWGMEFNVKKCKVLHLGNSNPKFTYQMNGLDLVEVEEETDVGVRITNDLKSSKQCRIAAGKARGVLAQLTRSFHYRDKYVFVRLYKQYVRPHLEYAISAWSPAQEGDKEVLEKVQKCFLSFIPGLKGETYEEKLKEIYLPSLEERRKRYDMIQVYKIVHQVDDVKREDFFVMASTQIRSTRLTADPLNIVLQKCRTEIRRKFFTNRIVEDWNRLPSEVKSAPKVNTFKRRYDALIN